VPSSSTGGPAYSATAFEAADFGLVSLNRLGAACDGVTDDADIVDDAIAASIAAGGVPIVANGPVGLGREISPPAGDFTFLGVKFVSLAAMTSADYQFNLHQAYTPPAVHPHTGVSFISCEFDCAFQSRGIYIENALQVNITSCKIEHFLSRGLYLAQGTDHHELNLTSSHIHEYPWPENQSATPSAVGLTVASNDHEVIGGTIGYCGTGVEVSGDYNDFSGLHVYGCETYNWRLTSAAQFNRFRGCYSDSGSWLIENPWHTLIEGTKFLANTTDDTFEFLTFKPMSAGVWLRGVKVTGCSFQNNQSTTVESIGVDTSAGSFSAGACQDVYIHGNSFVNTNGRGSRVRGTKYQTGSNEWTFNFDTALVEGLSPLWASATFIPDSGTFYPNTRIKTLARSTVASIGGTAANGVMCVEVDVNNYTVS
jgi:hypothetical protein